MCRSARNDGCRAQTKPTPELTLAPTLTLSLTLTLAQNLNLTLTQSLGGIEVCFQGREGQY